MYIKTVADLKALISNFPDDFPVKGYTGGNGDDVSILTYFREPANPESGEESVPDEPNGALVLDLS